MYQEFRKHARDKRLREGVTSQLLCQLIGEDQSPDKIWMKKERLSALENCVGGLPENSEQLIHLRFKSSYKSHEISEIVGMKAAAVRMSLMRIRRSLKDCVENRVHGSI